MAGLVLKLRPNECVLVNGVVLENGDRMTRLRVKTANANILRLRDALTAADVDTPIAEVCFLAQQAVAGAVKPEDCTTVLAEALDNLERFLGPGSEDFIRAARTKLADGRHYELMKLASALMPHHRAAS